MNRLVSPRRALATLGAAIIGAAVATLATPAGPAHAAIGPVVGQPFYADSGDACPLGLTTGVLGWHMGVGPLAPNAVDVSGYVVDRPTPTDPATDCRDPRYTTATFAAYRGSAVVDREQVTVDDAQLVIEFQLAGPPPQVYTPVDRVVIQVCRHAPPGMGLYDYCGKAVEYRPPPSPVV